MNTLDDLLGAGATEAFLEAMTLPDNAPSVIFSEWESNKYPDQSGTVNVIPDPEQTWPGVGVWELATITWSDASQQIFFQNKILCWGNGLCQSNGGVQGDSMQRLANHKFWTFLFEYVDEMRIELPNIEAFYKPFLFAGFEIVSQEQNSVRVTAYITNGSNSDDLFKWRIAGSIPEDEPAWRIALRETT